MLCCNSLGMMLLMLAWPLLAATSPATVTLFGGLFGFFQGGCIGCMSISCMVAFQNYPKHYEVGVCCIVHLKYPHLIYIFRISQDSNYGNYVRTNIGAWCIFSRTFRCSSRFRITYNSCNFCSMLQRNCTGNSYVALHQST